MYSYVIEISEPESDFCLHNTALVSEIFAFYHLQHNALGLLGRRGYVLLAQKLMPLNFLCIVVKLMQN